MATHEGTLAPLEERGVTQGERVVDTFIAPTKTFTDILRNTSWWLPFLLLVLVTLSTSFAIDRRVGYDRVAENQIHASPKQEEQLSTLTPAVRAQRVALMGTIIRGTSYASFLLILIFSAIGALVLWLTFNFGLGSRATFGQMLAVWIYASLPRLISGLLTLIVVLFGGNTEAFDLKNPVGTNLGYYLPDVAPTLRTALGFVDIIGLWNLALLILGTAIVAKVSRGKAAAVVIGWWVLVLVVSVAGAAVNG